MKAYIQCDRKGFPFNETVFCAYQGFEEMGIEIKFFRHAIDIEGTGIEDLCNF